MNYVALGVVMVCKDEGQRLELEEKEKWYVDEVKRLKAIVAGLPRARSAHGTEPYTHRIWSTSFRLVVT